MPFVACLPGQRYRLHQVPEFLDIAAEVINRRSLESDEVELAPVKHCDSLSLGFDLVFGVDVGVVERDRGATVQGDCRQTVVFTLPSTIDRNSGAKTMALSGSGSL